MTRLIDHLPRVLTQDELLCNILGPFQEIFDSLQAEIDGLGDQVDRAVAPTAMLEYLGRWINLQLPPATTSDRRALLAAYVDQMWHRGTADALVEVVAALTGCNVRVLDTGGVLTPGELPRRVDPNVVIRIDADCPATMLDAVKVLVSDWVPASVIVQYEQAKSSDVLIPVGHGDGTDGP